VALAIDLYLTSILDLETVGYFFANQKIILELKNTAKPPVDFLSSAQPAQSVSENALRILDEDFRILRPMPTVNFI
jgi:hypothetical protein